MLRYPLLLRPAFKDYIWGGTRLRDDFGKRCELERIAESWELSCHRDGESTIENGEYSGLTLSEYLEKNPEAAGKNCGRFPYFPVLIKLIDARSNLSVQVHPDDAYALKHENEYGKTEMWYIADCEDDAQLLYGFKQEISREEFLHRIENNTLLDAVQSVSVKKGDVFFIEAGTLHAIGKGILIAEIQQNSNTTYRVYDYGRIGADGKPRPLHIEQAAEVTLLKPAPERKMYSEENGARLLAKCDYFTVSLIKCAENADFSLDVTADSFAHIMMLSGEALLHTETDSLPLKKGMSVFLPACAGKVRIGGDCECIITTV